MLAISAVLLTCWATSANAAACGRDRTNACPEGSSWSVASAIRETDGWSFYYRVHGTRGDKLHVTISFPDKDPTTTVGVELFDSHGRQIPTPQIGYPSAWADARDPTGTFTEPLPYSGTYYLGLGASSYTLTVSEVQASDIEVPYRLRVKTSGPCGGSLWQKLKCDAGKIKTAGACAAEVAAFGPLKALRGIKIIKGFYDTRKVSKALRPVYVVYNDLMRLHFKNGLTGREVWRDLQHAKSVKDLLTRIIDAGALVDDVDVKDRAQLISDFADLVGVKSCVDLVVH